MDRNIRPRASFLLCLVLLAGLGAPAASRADANNANADLRHLIDAAESGSADQQYELARVFALGSPVHGVTQQDPAQALVWFRRAAERGHVDAQFALANAYEEGYGVAPNTPTALAWYKRAADGGHVLAASRLNRLGNAGGSIAPAPLAVEATDRTSERDFWPWWLGALALAFMTLAFWRTIGAPLGVSSSWDRIMHWREEEENARRQHLMHEKRDQLNDAMIAETIAQFGQEAVDKMLKARDKSPASVSRVDAQSSRIPWPAHVTFLATMAIGGLAASVLNGNFQIQLGLGSEFARLFGSGPQVWLVLLFGGFLVGFGTRMTGGCTSGHGLSGCSRLQPGSLVGTASFFAAAAVTSLLLEVLK
jgi:hypothetical protein